MAQNAKKPAVVTLSLGGGKNQPTNDAVTALHNKGVVVVVAAGNDNRDACAVSPASTPVVCILTSMAVASLTVPGGQEFHFPHFFLKFWSIFLIFPQTLLIFFLILAIQVGDSPTREGPGYATAYFVSLFLFIYFILFYFILFYFILFYFILFIYFFWFLTLPGCSFRCYHLFSHETQGRNVQNSLTVGMGFHCSYYVPSIR